ncbi:hypothetical protein BDZ91DRAFT_748031 [Kalaharituber pfeilii]|nr:hypothetical protein BDZ91DRAFT_748031 [Kalaharituber pfeilii]
MRITNLNRHRMPTARPQTGSYPTFGGPVPRDGRTYLRLSAQLGCHSRWRRTELRWSSRLGCIECMLYGN